jgi:hypothetical protein
MTVPSTIMFGFFFKELYANEITREILYAIDSITFLNHASVFFTCYITNMKFRSIVIEKVSFLFFIALELCLIIKAAKATVAIAISCRKFLFAITSFFFLYFQLVLIFLFIEWIAEKFLYICIFISFCMQYLSSYKI